MADFADLPNELIIEILNDVALVSYNNKNNLLEMRTVCKKFAEILKPIGLRTLQMDWTRMDNHERLVRQPLERQHLFRNGHLCRSLNIDMMIATDEDVCRRLVESFEPIPEKRIWAEMAQSRYTMNKATFTPEDYHKELETMIQATPNATALKLSLPYKLINVRSSHDASTFILGNTFDLLANRPEDRKAFDTLALENLSEMSLARLWRNPLDVRNIMRTFSHLRHMSLSIRRQTSDRPKIDVAFRLWEVICKARKLESLCLINVDKRDNPKSDNKLYVSQPPVPDYWEYHALPAIHNCNWEPDGMQIFRMPDKFLPNLTFLELRDVSVKGHALGWVLNGLSNSLQELYLDNVYMKTVYRNRWPPGFYQRCLWIGLPDTRPSEDQCWLATYIRQIGLKLRVCRVSNLSYDCKVSSGTKEQAAEAANYDLSDPCGPQYNRTLEQRFVEVVMGYKQPLAPHGLPVVYYPQEEAQDELALADRERPDEIAPKVWDASLYKTRERHLTSALNDSVDGTFLNYNPSTFKVLNDYIQEVGNGWKALRGIQQR